MPEVHPTAHVEDGASLASDVVVGAFSFVGREVELGPGVRVAEHVTLLGRTRIGPDCRIFPHAVLGGDPQDRSFDPTAEGASTSLEIGARCQIREHVTVHVGTTRGGGCTRIGEDAFLMNSAHIGHDCQIGNNVIVASFCGLGGHSFPFNSIDDFDTGIQSSTACADPANCLNAGNLEDIDDDIRLPLTERYFLGGLGTTRLRGFQGRSVGPRRPELSYTDLASGRVYHPVGTRLISNPATGQIAAICDDNSAVRNFGNGNGRCNDLGDKEYDDFEDLNESQVIGGNSYISSSFEYRFPISEEIGLLGIGFIDAGNAFAEGDILFDATEWRYGTGAGVLWFSPFGPLQLVLGFPIDARADEQSPVFEFSVGGLGI